MYTFDYFRILVLVELLVVFLLFINAAVRDYIHLSRIQSLGTRQIFFGRVTTAVGIEILVIDLAIQIAERLGLERVTPYSIIAQAAVPLLVIGWGYAFRHRYEATVAS